MIKKYVYQVSLLALVIFFQGCKGTSTLTSDGTKSSDNNSTTTPTAPAVAVETVHLNLKVPAAAQVNECVPLIVSLKNGLGSQLAAPSDLSIAISGDPIPLYSNSACSIAQPSPISLLKTTLSKVIYVRPTTSQSYVLEMQDTTGVAGPYSVILTANNPLTSTETVKLSFSGQTSISAGVCRAYTVSLLNSLGTNVNSATALAVALSGQAAGNFYAGTNCAGAPVSSQIIPLGQSFVSFSYKNSTAENVNLVADSPLGSAVQSTFYSIQINPVITSSPAQLLLSGPSSVTAGACSGPIVVRTVDTSLNSAATASTLNFTVTGGAGFSIFSDAGCSTSLAAPFIPASSSSTSLYFKAVTAGNIVVAADDSGPLTDGSLSVQVTATSGNAAVKFTLAGPASVKVQQCSSAFIINSTNGSGLISGVNATTTVNITGKGGGDFYSDAACTSVISSVIFAADDSSKPFYYKGLALSDLVFNVDDAGPLTPASANVSIISDLPTKLILTGPSPITLGECRAYVVTSKDTNNFVSTVSSSTLVNLSGAGSGTFYSDSSCVNSILTTVINAGQNNALFYFKTMSDGALTLSADNLGVLTTGTSAVTVNSLPYTKVVSNRPSVTVGSCTPVVLTLKDSLNNAAVATSATGITLSSTGSAAFYSASNCIGAPVTSATVAISQSSITVYLKDAVAETIVLGATSTGLSSESWSSTILAGGNDTLKLNGPATNSVGSCTAYDLRLEDTLGNLSPATTTVAINFTGLSNAKFYTDANCSTIANSATLTVSTSQAQLFLKGNVAESLTIGASSGALVAASKGVALIAGSSNKLVVTGFSTAAVGTCNAYVVAAQDNLNNPIAQGAPLVVTMSGNVSGAFYSDSGCTAATSTATIAAAASQASVWFKSNVPASLNFAAHAAGHFDGELSLVVNSLAPSKLVMTGASAIAPGVCTAYSISLQDTLNNLSSAGNAKTLNFSGALAGAFYSDSSCSTPAASISLTSTQAIAQIYYKASAAQTANLTVDDIGLPDLVSSSVSVTVGSAAGSAAIALKISGSTSIGQTTCAPYAIMTIDTAGFSYNIASNMVVTMAGAGTGGFYSDSGCTASATTATVTSGTSLAYIYYKNAGAQNLVFAATATSASAATLPVAVVAPTSTATPIASRLTVTGSSSILVNSCIPYVISAADTNGNSINVSGNTAITLSGSGSGTFYTDNVCSVSAAGAATISNGTSFTTVYYSNGSNQNLILIAQSTGLSNGTLSVGVSSVSSGSTSGPAVKLSFVAQPPAVASVSEVFGTQPIVAVQDTINNVATSATNTITLAAYTDSLCTLSAGATIAATANPLVASGGVANFAGVNITSAQVVYIKASSPGLASACSNAIQVYPAVAAKLAFSVQPSTTAVAGTDLATQPQVSVLNYTNAVVTTATNPVSIAAYTDIACTIPVTGTFNIAANGLIPASGVASFANINYSTVSAIYLKATADGLASACSSGITVNSAPAYRSLIYIQPATAGIGRVGDNYSMTVRLYDGFGNLSSSADSLTVTAYKGINCTGATTAITGGGPFAAALGTKTFSSIAFSEAGPTMSLKVTDNTNGAVLTSCSNSFAVDGGTPAKLAFSVQPAVTGRIYTTLSTPPSIQIQDGTAFSNLVKSATNTVTLSAYTGADCTATPATGVLSATNLVISPSSGVASFANVTYSKAEAIRLKATAAGLTAACSDPITFTGLPSKIITKSFTSCSITDGAVWCWGDNNTAYGKLGDNTSPAPHVANTNYVSSPYPVQVAGVNGVGYLQNMTDVTIASGDGNHVCALSATGSVYCWGFNNNGQLGDGTTTNRFNPVQVLAVGGVNGVGPYLTGVTAISAGDNFTCALMVAGNVYCWGAGSLGQLGDNAATQRSLPTLPVVLTGGAAFNGVTQISCGGAGSASGYCCGVITATSTGYCWGFNTNGQLGDGTAAQKNFATPILQAPAGAAFPGVVSISAGSTHTCLINNAGFAYCFGSNGISQLGDATTSQRNNPVLVQQPAGGGFALTGVVAISPGGPGSGTAVNDHTCAISNTTNPTKTYCWGFNGKGQLGTEIAPVNHNLSTLVTDVGGGVGSFLPDLVAISSGNQSTCGIDANGTAFCWGYNHQGQVGDQTVQNTVTKTTPVKVKDTVKSLFTSLSAANQTYCGVIRERAYCWGYNNYGQVGDGTVTARNIPTLVPQLTGVKDVSVSDSHACALLKSGKVWCWGYNAQGQLGNNLTTNSLVPVQVVGPIGTDISFLSDIVSLSVGANHTCAVSGTGSAYCWGINSSYQLGDATTTNRSAPVQLLAVGGVFGVGPYFSGVTSISAGSLHSCLVNNVGAAYCWGSGATYNQIGDGGGTTRTTPVLVTGLSSGVTAISAGFYSTCAIKSGAGFCWGTTYYTAGGVYTPYIGSTPTAIAGWGAGVTSISAGSEYVCAVVNKRVKCYMPAGGYQNHTAAANDVLNNIVSISSRGQAPAGGGTMCALRNNGVAYCWGYVSNSGAVFNGGILGSVTYPTVISIPVAPTPVASGTPGTFLTGEQHTNIAAGETHTCGILNGVTSCWGTSTGGALGAGISTSLTPTPVLLASTSAKLLGQAEVGAGGSHSCSLSFLGEVFCWGDNTSGKLGNNSSASTSKAVQVVGVGASGLLAGIKDLSVGYRHNCAVSAAGSVYCWGYNGFGQLGVLTTTSQSAPVQVKNVPGTGFLAGVSQVATGRYHSCALSAGNVYCWGSNSKGQLGANSGVTQSNSPIQVVSVSGLGVLENVTAISAGAYHTCAISLGSAYCWGSNSSKQLGNDSTVDSSYPVGVLDMGYVSLTGVSVVRGGFGHSCALTSIGEEFCWGSGISGQQGSGGTADQGLATNVLNAAGSANIAAISAISSGSSSSHSCAMTTDFTNIYCWGLGTSGQLGTGASASTTLPVLITPAERPYLIVR